MHIGMVHYAGPPTVGGVELTIFHHARALTALGHRVTVVAGKGAPFWPDVAFKEVPLLATSHPDILEATQTLAQGEIPAKFDALVERVADALLVSLGDCDVVIGHNLFTLHKNVPLTVAVHRLTQAGRGPRWVAWHHDFAWLRPEYKDELYDADPWTLLRRPWLNVPSVTVSQAQKTDLVRLYGVPEETIKVVPPGVEPLEFLRVGGKVAQLSEEWRLLDADCLFLLPARVTRRKNIELGLRWLAALRDLSGWDAHLVVTGPPGPHNPTNAQYLQELLALRDELALTDAAHFVYAAGALVGESESGAPLLLNDEEVAAFFALADALLFPSQQEGFGIPVLEAGLTRLPIFATDLSPFRESAGEWGTFFPMETPPAQVAQTMLDTLRDDRAFQLRRRVLNHFSWAHIVRNQVLPIVASTTQSNQI